MQVNIYKIPFKPASPGSYLELKSNMSREVQLIVLHSMEAPEKGTTAESVAEFFRQPVLGKGGKRPIASVHYCCDNNSIIQCVQTKDVAYGAAGANRNGIHIEHAGYARQSELQWLDAYGKEMLDGSAQLVAQLITKKFPKIRPIKLSASDLKLGKRYGIVGHADINQAFKKGHHWDPGPDFPWEFYLKLVKKYLEVQK